MRAVDRIYEDPLDLVWRLTAERIGLRLERVSTVFASTDGRGTLSLGAPHTLDRDDCLAQMVFHELCHSLVQGAASFEQPDWGLPYDGAGDLAPERACLRLQAALADHFGLRAVLAPTTDHRAFYDALPRDPLSSDDGLDGSARAAAEAFARVDDPPWAPHLRMALEATRRIVEVVAELAPDAASFFQRPPVLRRLGSDG